jgi:hypothetical protein
MRKAYWGYVDSIITPSEDNRDNYQGMKKFWQFVKSNKKDRQGVSTLKSGGKIGTNSIELP